MRFSGEVRQGKLLIDPASLAIALHEFDGRRVTLTIEAEKSVRTLQANRRYWGVLVPLAQHHLSQTRDIPLSKDQVHFVLVGAFAGCDQTPLGPVPIRTSTMSTAQFSEFCEQVQVWLAENGYAVPESAEVA